MPLHYEIWHVSCFLCIAGSQLFTKFIKCCILLNSQLLAFHLSGARVILACRDVEKGKEASEEIITSTKNKKVVCYKLDLASFQSIKDFVTTFKKGRFFKFVILFMFTIFNQNLIVSI